jgi:hypothetical protein
MQSPAKKHNFDKAYTHQDISKVFQLSPLRLKVAILIYASTGMRKGALVSLKLKISEADKKYIKLLILIAKTSI